jgi:anti-sigma B factor antagonist
MSEPHHDRERTRVDAVGIRPPRAFSIEERTALDGPSVIVLGGELDLAAAASMRRLIGAADRPGLVLDLTEVTFMDSSALRELLQARMAVAARGGRLVLAALPQPVRRLLEMTGTLALFDTAPASEDAVALLGCGS